MRLRPQNVSFILLLILCAGAASAQKIFKEGTLVYNVTLDPPDNQEGMVQHTGSYTIVIKDKQVRKELKMNNGFSNVMIFDENTGTVYTLKEMQGKKLAIQLDAEKMVRKRARFENFKLKEKGKDADIAGLSVRRGMVIYKDDNSKELYYSNDWKPEVELFEQLPGIQVLPLVFTSKTDDGMVMHFKAEKIIAEPVEGTFFKIPQDYKIMSSQEYKKLSSK